MKTIFAGLWMAITMAIGLPFFVLGFVFQMLRMCFEIGQEHYVSFVETMIKWWGHDRQP